MKKKINYFLLVTIFLFVFSTVFSTAYTRTVGLPAGDRNSFFNDLTHNYNFPGFVEPRGSDSAYVQSASIDWNKSLFSLPNGSQLTADNNLLGLWDANLISIWHLEENDGALIVDSKGGNNGNGGSSHKSAGINGNYAQSFRSVDLATVNLDAKAVNFAGNYSEGTVLAWIKTDSYADQSFFSISSNRWFRLGINTGTIYWSVYNGSTQPFYYSSRKALSDNRWHQIVYTVDATGNKIYIDGQFDEGSFTSGGSAASSYFFDDVPYSAGATKFRIGNFYWSTDGRYFDGNIDEVTVWNRALTPTEIQALYSLQYPKQYDQNLKVYWKFNELSYVMADEANGNGANCWHSSSNNLSCLSYLSSFIGPRQGGLFDTNGSYTSGPTWTVGGPSSISLDYNDGWSASSWVNFWGMHASGTYGVLVNGRDSSDIAYSLGVQVSGAAGAQLFVPYVKISNSVDGPKYCYATGVNIPIYQWHQLSGTYDGSRLKIFYDGKLINTCATTFSPWKNVSSRIEQGIDVASIYGMVEETKLYSYALSDQQMGEDFNRIKSSHFVGAIPIYSPTLSSLRWDSAKVNSSTNFSFGKEILSTDTKYFDQNLKALYHLNSSPQDSSGNGFDANLYGEGDEYVSGLWGTQAVSLDGNDSLSINSMNNLLCGATSTGKFSWSGWIKPDSICNYNPTWCTLYGSSGFTIRNHSSQSLYVYNGSTGIFSTTQPFNPNYWTHVVFTYGGGVRKLYINGQLVLNTVGAITFNNCSSYYPQIGALNRGDFFRGDVEEIALWDKDLSYDDVVDLFRKGVSSLDLNFYSCADYNCNNKTASVFIADANNNQDYSLAQLPVTNYLGYDAFFKTAPSFSDYNFGFGAYGAFLKNVVVDASPGNTNPIMNFNLVGTDNAKGAISTKNGTVTLDFDVFDLQNDRLDLNVYLSNNSDINNLSSDTLVITDLNLTSTQCSSITWNVTSAHCTLDINTPLAIDAQAKYVKLLVSDLSTAGVLTDYNVSSPFILNNVGPVLSFNLIDSNDAKGILPTKSGTVTIDFNVQDQGNDVLDLNVYLSNNNSSGNFTGDTIAISSSNFVSTYCAPSADWSTTSVKCTVPINTALISDGSTKYIKLKVADNTYNTYDISSSFAINNIAPVVTFNLIGSSIATGSITPKKEIITIDFNINDPGTSFEDLNVYLSNNNSTSDPLVALDTIAIQDLNLTSLNCSSGTWENGSVNCTLDSNTFLTTDGVTKYIKLKIKNNVQPAVFSVSSGFTIDNTFPVVTWNNVSNNWRRHNNDINLSCADATTSCSQVRYQINGGTWEVYSAPVSLPADGNYLIQTDANDLLGNRSTTQAFNILVGFNGNLRTYNDLNNPESFFSENEKAELVYDMNLAVSPRIQLIDSNGVIVVDSVMTNISQDSTFGKNDLNTYYFDFNLIGEFGWYDAIIQNQLFSKAFFKSRTWVDRYTDYNGVNYPFSFDLNLTEPNVTERRFSAIDTNIHFNYKANPTSIRVLDFKGSVYKEVPSEVYLRVYSGSLITDARLVFLSTLYQGQQKTYAVSYASSQMPRSYSADLNSSLIAPLIVDFNNSAFEAKVDLSNGAVLSSIKSWIGKGSDLNNALLTKAPQSSLGSSSYSDLFLTNYSLASSGPLVTKLNAYGPMGSFDYNVTYTTYAKSKYILFDSNAVFNSVSQRDIYNLVTSEQHFQKGIFTKNTSYDGAYAVIDLNSTGNNLSFTDLNLISLTNSKTLDSYSEAYLLKTSSKPMIDTTRIREDVNSIYIQRRIAPSDIGGDTLALGDYYSTKTAIIISNPLDSFEDVNKIYLALTNPLQIVTGRIVTNDSQIPTLGGQGYSPADANDSTDLNCYAAFFDNTLLSRVEVNITGADLNIFESQEFLDQNIVSSYVVDSNTLNSGNVNCTFTAYDIADNNITTSFLVSVADKTPPVIESTLLSLDSNALLDPQKDTNFDANVTEYLGLQTVELYTRTSADGNNWSEWSINSMQNDLNNSSYNYHYTYLLTTDSNELIYQFFVHAVDLNGNDSNSSVETHYSFYDYTWEVSPQVLPAVTQSLNTVAQLGSISITNTGDKPLTFKLSTNWENKSQIWFSGDAETLTGKVVGLSPGDSQTYLLSATTKLTERSDPIIITVDPYNAQAIPDSNTVNATLVSLSNGPFMLIEWTKTNPAVRQEDENVLYTVKLSNAGNADANEIIIDWNYPFDWTLTDGNSDENLSETISVGLNLSRSLIFSIPADANNVTQILTFTAGCNSDENKTQTSSTTTVVYDKTGTSTGGNNNNNNGGGSGTGGGGGGGGGNTGSGGLPFVPGQEDKFFQTSSFFELVRGQDNTFPIKFTNPLDNNLQNIHLSVSGIISRYLKLKDENIAQLDSNQEFSTEIEIVSPKYFTPGKYALVFTITGEFIDRYRRPTSFIEERTINLLVHDVNESTANEMFAQMQSFLTELQKNNYRVNDLPFLVKDANTMLGKRDFDGVAEKYMLAKKVFDDATLAANQATSISGLIGLATSKGIETPNTDRLLVLAQLAFQRGDYALALSRLKEAELTYSIETKGEFNWIVWALANIDKIILMLVLFIAAAYMFNLGFTMLRIDSKLKSSLAENTLLLSMIAGIQKRSFVENKMSLSEYYDALAQFEDRIASVSESIVDLTTRKSNMLKFSRPSTRLNQEKRSLLDLIRDTQQQYFNFGLVETRIYQTKVKSLTKRLTEVDEEIVSSDLKKTLRMNGRGPSVLFWKLYYFIFR
ncbi:MAG: LamG-like jellyroll fold domain-containing protein [archaeon]